jgi:hypothetical protein
LSLVYTKALEEARTLYQEVLAITKELCSESDFEKCSRLVSDRGRLIIRANELVGKPFAPSEEADEVHLKQVRSEIHRLIKESIEWDRQAQFELSGRMGKVRAELQGMKKKSRVAKCYAAQTI